MKRSFHAFLLLGPTSLACSGQYEVGGMMGHGGGAGASAVAGSSSLHEAGTGQAAAGSSGAVSVDANDGDELGSKCVPLGEPSELTGPFVDGETLWGRVAPLIDASVTATPDALTTSYTYDEVGMLVKVAFAQARAQAGGSGGAQDFVADWLRRDGEDALSLAGDWASVLAEDAPALPRLLQTRLSGTGRIGVFTEPQWLVRHRTISSRGYGISYSLFQEAPPTPPANNDNGEPDQALTDRDALVALVGAQPCISCHQLFDPLGYPLGNFDAAGEYRDLDHGQAPALTGSFRSESLDITYDGLMDFGVKVADTCVANRGIAKGFLRFVLREQGVPTEEREKLLSENLERVAQAFIRGGRSYPDLVMAYAQSPLALRP
ncbi:MAG TPA: DUF1588 domain-containing protein [Polyangiaceae bacterium]|nr:DUF1588 domain-containing protein [Polyangiaceae bacterium]